LREVAQDRDHPSFQMSFAAIRRTVQNQGLGLENSGSG
jgi:hypothetical protein